MIVTELATGDLTAVDLLLIEAACADRIAYRHTRAAAVNLFLFDGLDVDLSTANRLAILCTNGFLHLDDITEDCPVGLGDRGRAVLR